MCKKMPMPDYIDEIRQKELTYDEAIERILEENGVIAAPIPVIKIAKSLGFVVYSAVQNSGNKDIISVMADSAVPQLFFRGQREIIVNSEIHPMDQQLAVAHEITHLVMHCNEDRDFFEKNVRGPRVSNIEKEADDFALKLVVPTWMLRGYVMGITPSGSVVNLVRRISETFFISEENAWRRLCETKCNPRG